ncbi:MAG: efflux RND transporter periplasmic adaptor subunit [Gammaproteobacteria bacterium]|jgi:RND family efflux transporter MFP subunit|nr:efflux RND transporter periplasmic adaptor subunit [Gammaproteobacteria bacterium]
MDNAHGTREPRPGPLKGLVYLCVLGLIGAGLFLAAMTLRSEEGPKLPGQPPEPVSVSVVRVEPQESFEISERFTGLATPRRTSQLGFTTGGRIDRLAADVGDQVARGALLGRIDTRNLRAQLAAAEASIDEAMAARELALKSVQRQRDLRDKGHVSQQVVDEVAAQASSADARVEAARAQADTLRVQIDLARIVAPFAGVITQRFADEGTIAAPGQPVFELVELASMEARIGLPAPVARELETGETYQLTADGQTYPASLRAKTGVIDSRQRTVAAVFDLSSDGTIPPGSVVRLAVERELDERGSWVPVAALTEAGRGLWSLMVAESEGDTWFAAGRQVEIVHTSGERAYVRGSLQPGDRVIVDGLQRLVPGQPVTPFAAEMASGASGSLSHDR